MAKTKVKTVYNSRYVTSAIFNPYHKKPDYYYSFLGYFIMQAWIYENGFSMIHLRILIILSYYEYMLYRDFRYWRFYHGQVIRIMDDLTKMGYVTITTTAARGAKKPRKMYILTKKGKDLSTDYERFYDVKWDEFMNKKFGDPAKFDDAPYRRVKKTKAEMKLMERYRPTWRNVPGTFVEKPIFKRWKDLEYDEEK